MGFKTRVVHAPKSDPLLEGIDVPSTITIYELTDTTGFVCARVMDYGATLTHLIVTATPTTETDEGVESIGRDIVLGFDDPFDYVRVGRKQNPYFGCTVGRACNRTANGEFSMNGKTYHLPTNNGPNSLHGGINGFDKRQWTGTINSDTSPASVSFHLHSPDGDEGFPCPLDITATYALGNNGDLSITYHAAIPNTMQSHNDAETYVNLTNHAYFNLDGLHEPTVVDHVVDMPGIGGYLELTPTQIPTDVIICPPTQPHMHFIETMDTDGIRGRRIGDGLPLVTEFRGYDHFYLRREAVDHANRSNLSSTDRNNNPVDYTDSTHNASDDKTRDSDVSLHTDSVFPQSTLVTITSPQSGIIMTVTSTAAGFQLYTANWLDDTIPTKRSTQSRSDCSSTYGSYSGVCVETSAPPDAVNNRVFRSLVCVGKHVPWTQTTTYTLSLSPTINK